MAFKMQQRFAWLFLKWIRSSITFLDMGNINTEDSLWMLSAIVNHNLWNIDYKKMNKIEINWNGLMLRSFN